MQGRATLFGHPLHPILIPFPVVAVFVTLANDVRYRITGDDGALLVATVAATVGLVFAVLAAILGLVDYFTAELTPGARKTATTHLVGGLAIVGIYAVDVVMHRAVGLHAFTVPVSALGVVAVIVTGLLGGHLVFVHGIGVARKNT